MNDIQAPSNHDYIVHEPAPLHDCGRLFKGRGASEIAGITLVGKADKTTVILERLKRLEAFDLLLHSFHHTEDREKRITGIFRTRTAGILVGTAGLESAFGGRGPDAARRFHGFLSQVGMLSDSAKNAASQVIMLGSPATAIALVNGKQELIELSGVLPFGLDESTESIYAFRALDGFYAEVVRGGYYLKDEAFRWATPKDRIAPKPVVRAGRGMRLKGSLRFSLEYADGTTGYLTVSTNGQCEWSKPGKDEHIISPIFDSSRRVDGLIVARREASGERVSYLPAARMTAGQRFYAEAGTV